MLANALTWLQHISQNKFWARHTTMTGYFQTFHKSAIWTFCITAEVELWVRQDRPHGGCWRVRTPSSCHWGRSVSRSWLLLASGRYCACADPGKPCSAQSTHAQTALYRHILLEVRMHFIDDENIFFVSPSTHGRKKCLCKIFLLSYIHMTSN